MTASQLYFVSGKGGVGKTTIAVALAQHAAARGERVLIVEPSSVRGGIAPLFGRRQLPPRPTPLAARLEAVRVEPRVLLEGYFKRLLPLPFFSGLLLRSRTFNVLTAATPGVSEFLILESLLRWTGARSLKRSPRYDLVVVDGPATGHALRLLRAPRQFAAMVPGGPIGAAAEKLVDMLTNHEQTHVLLVTLPDELAVNETIETRETLVVDLALHVTRPVINRVSPQHFTRREAEIIAELSRSRRHDALLAAARLQIGRSNDARRHVSRLRRAFGGAPVPVRQFYAGGIAKGELERIGAAVGRLFLRGR